MVLRQRAFLVFCGLVLTGLSLYAAPDPALVESLKPIAAQGKLIWSPELTVTNAAGAAGAIEAGKTNIQITGPVNAGQIAEISGALLKAENKNQLVRLDLSRTSGLTELGRNAFRNKTNLGSILLPEGITFIERDAFLDAACLIELSLPDSLALVNGNTFHRTGLPRIALPAKVEWNGFRFVSPFVNWAVIFQEGRSAVPLTGFAPDPRAGDVRLTLALPATLTQISAVDADTGNAVSELYCYAARPPEYAGKPGLLFPNAKTVYVPAGSVNAYKSAWSAYTRAEFKALPPEKAALSGWLAADIVEAYKAAGGK